MMGGAGFDLGLGLYGLRGWGEVVKYDAVAMTMVSVVKVEKSGCQYIILCASCMLSCVCTDVYNVYKYVAYSIGESPDATCHRLVTAQHINANANHSRQLQTRVAQRCHHP